MKISKCILLSVGFCLYSCIFAQNKTAIKPQYTEELENLNSRDKVQHAFSIIDEIDDQTIEDMIRLTEVPAPPFKESERASLFREMLESAGADSTWIDEEGNVLALRKGQTSKKRVVLDAHIDVVFPEGTNVKVTRAGDTLKAPGIGDNTRGMAMVLAVLKAMNKAEIKTNNDILLVGTVGEEGLGDLRGVKHIFNKSDLNIGSWISIDGGSFRSIRNAGVGSKRYRVVLKGKGGHSWGSFGLANPHHALGKAIDHFVSAAKGLTDEGPRTSFNIGRIGGGTSVNSIPFESWMEVDMRSVSPKKLDRIESLLKKSVTDAVADYNKYHNNNKIELVWESIGNRPSGELPAGLPLIQRAMAATKVFGENPRLTRSSTNANTPISMGIPAICIGRGGKGGGAHSLDEWFINRDGAKALKKTLLITLAEAGMAHSSDEKKYGFNNTVNDLKKLQGTYKLTGKTEINIKGKRFSLGEASHIIEATEEGHWHVPELDIVFSATKKNGENILIVERYGEIVEVGKELPAGFRNYKDMPLETLADLVASRVMIANNVPGVSIALIKDQKVVSDMQYGLKNRTDPEARVDASSVFEAASMSKPVFAYFALRLVEQGKLDLDTPLVEYLGKDYTEDSQHRKITARMVLTHTSGFPNWRPGGRKKGGLIPVLFEPGTKQKYSGEGIWFLQKAVEKILDTDNPAEALDDLLYQSLLKPIGMPHSHYIWQEEYHDIYAEGHNRKGEVKRKPRRPNSEVNAAFTLYTTPVEYAHFLLELMKSDRSTTYSLEEELWREMTTPQSDIGSTDILLRRDRTAKGTRHFGFGLRIDSLDSGLRIGHTGSNSSGHRCVSDYNPKTGSGVVIMTNGDNGSRVYKALLSYLAD